MTSFYDTLNINKNANSDEISKAYKKLALKWHPDRHKSEEDKKIAEDKFKKIGEAYSVLSDNDKRKIYDMTGSADGQSMPTGNANPFSGRHAGGFHGNMNNGPNSGTTFRHFSTNGTNVGSGGNVDPHEIFKTFFGGDDPFTQDTSFFNQRSVKKQRNVHVQPIPFTLEELYTGCTKKVKIREITKEITVQPGWKEGANITFGDIIPNSDVKFIVNQLPHNLFKRDDTGNLHHKITLTANEAINGFTKTIRKLDGTTCDLKLNKLNSSDYVHTIKSGGMPIRKGGTFVGYGNMIITFVVIF
jgi:DnaJ family protein B protein 4